MAHQPRQIKQAHFTKKEPKQQQSSIQTRKKSECARRVEYNEGMTRIEGSNFKSVRVIPNTICGHPLFQESVHSNVPIIKKADRLFCSGADREKTPLE